MREGEYDRIIYGMWEVLFTHATRQIHGVLGVLFL
jgi:hypothetical protein